MIIKLILEGVAYLEVLVHHLVDDNRVGKSTKVPVRVPVIFSSLIGVRHLAGVVVPHVSQLAAGQPPPRQQKGNQISSSCLGTATDRRSCRICWIRLNKASRSPVQVISSLQDLLDGICSSRGLEWRAS